VQPETGVLASPTVAIERATEAGASPAQEIAQQKVVDHRRDTESEVTIAAESGAAVAETEMPPTSTRQTARPSASILPQLISQRAQEAPGPKRVKVLIAATVMLAVVAAALVAIEIGNKRAKQPPSDHWLYSLYRIFPAIRHRNTSQTG